MLRTLREWLTLGLIVLLPFHALLVTVGTKLVLGPGHAPLSMIAGWKEGVLGVILIIAFVEIIHNFVSRSREHVLPAAGKVDLIDALILALVAVSLALLLTGHPSVAAHYILGFKYDFIPLITFLILRRVPWSDEFRNRVPFLLLITGCIVAHEFFVNS